MQLVRQAGRELGEVLAASVNFFNPGVIVIGGDIAHADEHLLAGVREVVYQRVGPAGHAHAADRPLRARRPRRRDRRRGDGDRARARARGDRPHARERRRGLAGSGTPPRRRASRLIRLMPELPEAERARVQIDRALDREIVAVDDRDTYVCRPHAPGEIAAALTGQRLLRSHRRGKFLWVETDAGRSSGCTSGWRAGSWSTSRRRRATGTASRSSSPTAGGSRCATSAGSAARSSTPDFSHVGPDAAEVSRDGVPRAGRPRQGAAQGAAARPGRDRRRRQPARRRDAVARAAVAAAAGRAAVGGGAGPAAAPAASGDARRRSGEGGVHTGDVIARAAPGRALPALRDADGARGRRRADDVLVPRVPARRQAPGS